MTTPTDSAYPVDLCRCRYPVRLRDGRVLPLARGGRRGKEQVRGERQQITPTAVAYTILRDCDEHRCMPQVLVSEGVTTGVVIEPKEAAGVAERASAPF